MGQRDSVVVTCVKSLVGCNGLHGMEAGKLAGAREHGAHVGAWGTGCGAQEGSVRGGEGRDGDGMMAMHCVRRPNW